MDQQRGFLLGAIAVTSVIAGLMVSRFTGYLLAGIILAFVMYPAQKHFLQYMRSGVAAASVIILTVLLAIVPVLATVGFVADDATDLVRDLETRQVPELAELEQRIEAVIGEDIDLRERIKSVVKTGASYVAASASQLVSFAANLGIGLSLMLFVQFYVLKDGSRFVAWTKEFEVMPTTVQERLYERTANTTWAVIKGHVFVAILQGIIAGIGLFVVGIPNAVFWTMAMILLGFIPLVGTAFVWVPAAIYLALSGQPVMAGVLFAYGIIVVGATDNFARPLLVDESADLHEVFILLGVVGGVIVFGAIGIFIGPIMFGVLKDLLELYKNNYAEV